MKENQQYTSAPGVIYSRINRILCSRAENVSPQTAIGQGPGLGSKFMLVHELIKALNSVKTIQQMRKRKKLTVLEMGTGHWLS